MKIRHIFLYHVYDAFPHKGQKSQYLTKDLEYSTKWLNCVGGGVICYAQIKIIPLIKAVSSGMVKDGVPRKATDLYKDYRQSFLILGFVPSGICKRWCDS